MEASTFVDEITHRHKLIFLPVQKEISALILEHILQITNSVFVAFLFANEKLKKKMFFKLLQNFQLKVNFKSVNERDAHVSEEFRNTLFDKE